MAVVRLADYRPAPFLIERTDLTVCLHTDHTLVEASLAFRPNPAASQAPPQPLELMGLDLELESLGLDGQSLAPQAYRLERDRLVLLEPPQRPFKLQSRVRIHPERNTTLEGLY
ncbi:MAG: aminopeptidase N, partial [Cyanobacteriota bacterium]|nr:aminopeptidase N [Cyanobacteriota bacterium]